MIRFLFLVTVFVFVSLKSNAQNLPYRVTHIGLAEGLSQGSVYSILRDSRGLMWFGSQDGLNMFDGKKITVFKPEPGNSKSISGRKIGGIVEDGSGNVWIGTEMGLNKYNYIKNSFVQYFNGEEVLPIEFTDGFLWFWTDKKGFVRMDVVQNKFSIFFNSEKFSTNYTNTFNSSDIISKSEFWVHSDKGIVYSKDGKNEIYFSQSNVNKAGKPLFISKIKWWNNRLYLGTEDGLRILDPKNNSIERFENFNTLKIGLIQDFGIDSNGKIWIGTQDKGLLIFDTKTKTFEQISRNTESKPGLSDNFVSFVYVDQNEVIWVNSDPYGIDRIERLAGNFSKYALDFPPDFPEALRNYSIRSILEDGQNLWLGTLNSGIWILNKQDFSVKKYFIKDNSDLVSDHISQLIKTSTNQIFIASDAGITEFINEQPVNIPIINFKRRITGVFVRSMEEYDKKLYLSTEEGILIYDLIKKKLSTERLESDSRMVFTFHPNRQKWYFGNMEEGLVKVKNGIKTIMIPDVIPIFIKNDSKGNLWCGTSEGLFHFDLNDNLIKKYTLIDGLPNDFVYCGEFDNRGILWLSTNRGIVRFDPLKELFTTFNLNDGLQDYEYNSFASYKNSEGRIYFGGVSGLNYFMPDDIKLPVQVKNNILKKNLKSLIPTDYQVFLDKDSKFKKPEIKKVEFRKSFVQLNAPLPNFLYTNGTGWVKFDLRNETNEKWYLEVENTRLSELEIWIFEKNREVYYSKTGDKLPFEKYLIKDPNPTFELDLIENQQYEIYLKARTSRDLKIPVRIWNVSALSEHQSNRKLIWGVFIGFIILISFYNLFLWLTIKDQTYLYYMIYILSFGLFQFAIYGFAFQYFWSNHPFNEYAFLMFLYISYLFITLFTEKFLDLNHKLKYWHLIKGFIMTSAIALICITPFWHPNEINYFAIILSLLFTILFYYICYVYIKARDPLIFYYSFAIFFLSTSSFVLALQNLGILRSLNQEYVLMTGSMIEIVLFSLALGYKFRQNYLEKERQQQLRNQISGDLHDDLAASLSSLTMYVELSKRRVKEDIELTDRLQAIAEKSRNILSKVRNAVYELNPSNDQEEGWLERITDFGKEIFESKNIDFKADIAENFDSKGLKPANRRQLIYLFKEAMNNAAKYSNADSAHFSAEKKNGHRFLTLKDNGSGFDHSKISKGNGLTNMKNRAEKIGAEFEIISMENRGTEIKIRL